MQCPVCGEKTRVLTVKGESEKHIRRLRECKECLTRMYSYEQIDVMSIPKYVRRKAEC